MFDTFKKILLEELKEDIEEARKILDEIQSLKEETLRLKEPEEDFSLMKPKDPKQTYNFFEKIIRYGDYKKSKINYETKIKEYNEYIEEIKRKNDEYTKRKKYIEDRLIELREKKDPEKLQEIIRNYDNIIQAKNFNDLGYTFDQVIDVLDQKGIPLVLDSTDKVEENESKIEKLDDLILIHKTNYIPNENTIKTISESGIKAAEQVEICGNILDINFNIVRNTIHFCVNGEVASHGYGDWNDKKYAAVIPLKSVPNIGVFNPIDTFSNCNVDINQGFFLCPVDEVEKIKEANPGVNVIGYKGKENVTGFANTFISMLGYKYEPGDQWGWLNEEDNNEAIEIVKNNTLIRRFENHSYTIEKTEEDVYEGINEFKSIIEKLFESNVDFDPKKAAIQLSGYETISKKNYLRMSHTNIMSAEDGKYFNELLVDLKQYGIEMPNYIHDLYNAEYNNGKLFSIDNIKKNENIPEDTKIYLDEIKKLDNNENNYKYTEKAFIYETLKQVRKLNNENIFVNQTENKVYS